MATIVNRKVRTFKDLNLAFGAHPVTGDVNKHFDEDAIKNAIKNLILTKNYERPFHPEIGSQAAALLFENFTPITAELIKKSIETTIVTYEPRAQILDIRIAETDDANEIAITVEFKPVNSEKPLSITTFLTRVR
jgi:phage baseplate assembly protein W